MDDERPQPQESSPSPASSDAPTPTPADPAPTPEPPHYGSEFSFRRLIDSATVFLIVIILLRAIAIEPFGVPTGSMALTLAGNHKRSECPRCGHPIVVGSSVGPSGDLPAGQRAYSNAWCPNCEHASIPLTSIEETAGDRLLVDKNVFELRKPRRWEVAVFRCPSDESKPYVKRVVGLPGERILVRNGDVYVDDHLLRKSHAEARSIQIQVFDNDYQPNGRGWRDRWRTGSPALSRIEQVLTDADPFLNGPQLRWPAPTDRTDFRWLIYRHWLLEDAREDPIRDTFSYNGIGLRHELKFVHDFIMEFDLTVGPGQGTVALGLRDGHEMMTAEISAGAGAPIRLRDTAGLEIAQGLPFHLIEGASHHVVYAFVDRRVTLSIDGKELISGVDRAEVGDRLPVSRPAWIGVRGVAATVSHFRLSRDIFYSATGRNGIFDPWPLGPDEYFMLGDNSANSEDSRYWSHPGIPEANFLGKPLLLHQPSRWATIRPGWDVQTVDWTRVRWIR